MVIFFYWLRAVVSSSVKVLHWKRSYLSAVWALTFCEYVDWWLENDPGKPNPVFFAWLLLTVITADVWKVLKEICSTSSQKLKFKLLCPLFVGLFQWIVKNCKTKHGVLVAELDHWTSETVLPEHTSLFLDPNSRSHISHCPLPTLGGLCSSVILPRHPELNCISPWISQQLQLPAYLSLSHTKLGVPGVQTAPSNIAAQPLAHTRAQ